MSDPTPTVTPIAPITGQPIDANTFATGVAPPVKPGVQTSELYVSLFAKLLGVLAAAGVLGGEAYMKIAGISVVAVVTVGYAISRGLAKGGASLLVIGLLGVGGTQLTACKGPAPVPVTDLIDCVKQEGSANWPTIVAQLTPDLGDWSKLVADVATLGPKMGFDIVRCVGEELIAQYLSVKHNDTASTWSAHDAAEKIRATASAPGRSVTFVTSHGNL